MRRLILLLVCGAACEPFGAGSSSGSSPAPSATTPDPVLDAGAVPVPALDSGPPVVPDNDAGPVIDPSCPRPTVTFKETFPGDFYPAWVLNDIDGAGSTFSGTLLTDPPSGTTGTPPPPRYARFRGMASVDTGAGAVIHKRFDGAPAWVRLAYDVAFLKLDHYSEAGCQIGLAQSAPKDSFYLFLATDSGNGMHAILEKQAGFVQTHSQPQPFATGTYALGRWMRVAFDLTTRTGAGGLHGTVSVDGKLAGTIAATDGPSMITGVSIDCGALWIGGGGTTSVDVVVGNIAVQICPAQ